MPDLPIQNQEWENYLMAKKNYVRRTEQEWSELIDDFYQSNLSTSKWCLNHNIPTTTFCDRLKRVNKNSINLSEHKASVTESHQEIFEINIDSVTEDNDTDAYASATILSDEAIKMEYLGARLSINNNASSSVLFNVLSTLQKLC